MRPTLLIVVSGLPASGKSYLGSRLARELRVPYVTKDDYKQINHLTDLPNAQAGPLSFSLMYHVAGVTLAAGVDTVLETHFYLGLSEPIIHDLARKHGASIVQVYCHAPLPELKRRHAARVSAGTRPKIDFPFDHEDLPPTANWEPLALTGALLRVDTTQPDVVQTALAWVQRHRQQ